MRRSEIARAQVEHLDLAIGILTIPVSKTGKLRTVPLSPAAVEALKGFLRERSTGSVTQLTSDGIRSVLRRLNAPPAHAWRRGWAVHALRNGVSEVSVRTIAGWSSGAMVARYTAALSNELAISEFEQLWGKMVSCQNQQYLPSAEQIYGQIYGKYFVICCSIMYLLKVQI